jgi:hypothetical protein
MGPEPDVVYSTNGTHGQKAKATTSSSRVLGRLPDMPRQGREGSQYEGLPEGVTGDRQAASIIRLDTASDEGEVGREYTNGTPWLRYRPGSHALLHSAANSSQGTWHLASYPAAGAAREAVGFEGQVTIVLWCMRLIVTGNALFSLLHQQFVRRNNQKAQRKPSIKEWESLPLKSSVDKGPADVEKIGKHRQMDAQLDRSQPTENGYRGSGRGLWWDAGRCGQPRGPWTVARLRDMEMEGQSRVHCGQGTQGNSYGAHGNAGRTSEEGRNIFIEALRRKLECRACDKLIRGVQPAHDERTPSLEEGARRAWAPAFIRVDTIRCKQIRKRTVTSFLT